MRPSGRAIGIDFGTTNSVVAVIDRDGSPRIITTREGATMMPSLVWFAPEGPFVGEAARVGLDRSPEWTIFGVKRLLGRRFDHPQIQELSRILPYRVVPGNHGDAWIALPSGRLVSPQEVCALVLRELRTIAEESLGEPAPRAVITIPAWYDAAQRQATKDAAQIAGITVMRLVSEPTAAALGHGAHRGKDRRYLVCDLGGGTFDVALVDLAGGLFEVLATTGDPFLGGDDVDRLVVQNLVREIRAARGVDVSVDAVAVERLREHARRAKHDLSHHSLAQISVPALIELPSGKASSYARELRRDEVELWSSPLLRRLEAPIREALARGGRTREQIDDVLLVGGMSQMPAVRREIGKLVAREPTSVVNPEEVVAVGAALEVARLEGLIEGILLVDVAARGIAISPVDGACDVMIAPSSVVPTREARVMATRHDWQQRIEFDVWEGESTQAADNQHYGRYAALDLPSAPAGDVLVVIEVTLDTDGAVRLGASELISGERLELEHVSHVGLSRGEVVKLAQDLAAATQDESGARDPR